MGAIGSNHTPLRIPDSWTGKERAFVLQLEDLLTQIIRGLDNQSKRLDRFVYTPVLANSDLNDYIIPGFYGCATAQIAATLSHCPRTDGNFTLVVSEKGPGVIFQQFNIGPYIYIRSRTAAGVWGNWYQHGPLYDGLDSTSAGQALTANQGYILKGLVDSKLAPGDEGATAITSGADLNSLYAVGDYYSPTSTITNSLSHCPVTGVGFRMWVISTALNYNHQLILHGNNKDMFVRPVRKDGTSAGEWSRFIHSDNVANDLLTTDEGYVLDARQGTLLNNRIGTVLQALMSKVGVTVVESIPANSSITLAVPDGFRGLLITEGAVVNKAGIYIVSSNSSGTVRVATAFSSSDMSLTTATRALTVSNTAQYVATAIMFNFVGETTLPII